MTTTSSLSQSAPCPPRLLLAMANMFHGAGASPLTATVTGTLSLEIEALKSIVQVQTQGAMKAEVALSQLASKSKVETSSLLSKVQNLSNELLQLRISNQSLVLQEETSWNHRQDLRLHLTRVLEDNEETQRLLNQERISLSNEVRQAQSRESEAEEEICSLFQDTEDLRVQVGELQQKMGEGEEVVSAVSAQLIDFKQAVQALQVQLRRGGRP